MPSQQLTVLPSIVEGRLTELVRDHGPALRRFLLRLTAGDQQLAEDIAQDALLRLWQRPDVLAHPSGPIRPWLFTVARNLVIDHWRARKGRPRETADDGLAMIATTRDEISRTEQAQDMLRAMAGLKPEHRAVLREVYYRGLSIQDAARELGAPLGTTRSRVYYALRALRSRLEELDLAPPA